METFEKLFVGILLTVYFIEFVIKNVLQLNGQNKQLKANQAK